MATNQRGIARGRMTEADLAVIHARMREEVARAGGRIDAIYHCPHAGGCACRKPAPGMLRDAARDLGLSLARTAMVGDRAHDMDAARAVGARLVMVAGDQDAPPPDVERVVPDLLGAVDYLLGENDPRVEG